MRRWIPALAAGVLLAGCGGAQTAAVPSTVDSQTAVPHSSWDTSQLPDPCRTLTNTEIAGVVGGTVSPGVRLESWPPLCQYVLDAQQREFVYVSDDTRPVAKQDYESKRSVSTANEAITGLGDQAYWQPDVTSLHVLAGDTHVFVAFAGPVPPAGVREKAETLARLILPRTKV